jgi:8-oxo-dGTP pyrophosphatase MutT (NUDIX family)
VTPPGGELRDASEHGAARPDSGAAPGTLAAVLAHPDVRRLARSLAERPGDRLALPDPQRRAAVALILRLGDAGALELLMIKRAVFAGDPWSGHVALPGGRQEPGDLTLEETAVRETREETAVDVRARGRILGTLDELEPRTPVLPPIVITPFVAVAERDVEVVPSPEVALAFWVPLAALQDPSASREIVLELTGGPRTVPSFQHEGYTIWGLTERILRQFLALLA